MIYIFVVTVLIITFIIIKLMPKKSSFDSKQPVKSMRQYVDSANESVRKYNDCIQTYMFLASNKYEEILNMHDQTAFEKFNEIKQNFEKHQDEATENINRIQNYIDQGKMDLDAYMWLKDAVTYMEIYVNQIEEIQPVKHTKNQIDIYETEGLQKDVYFTGCTTKEEIDKRYRALAKVFHPDNQTGDQNAFNDLQKLYECKLKEIKNEA